MMLFNRIQRRRITVFGLLYWKRMIPPRVCMYLVPSIVF
jgi:hypothetical protein